MLPTQRAEERHVDDLVQRRGWRAQVERHRPLRPGEAGFLEWLRRLFLGLACLLALPLTATLLLASPRPLPARLLGVALVAVLLGLASSGIRRAGPPTSWLAFEGPALLLVILVAADPEPLIGFSVALVVLRSLYCVRRSTFGGALAYSGAFLLGSQAMTLMGRDADVGATLSQPALCLVLSTLLHLVAVSTRRHERGARRDGILSAVGAKLAAASDPDAVRRAAHEAVAAVSATDRRLRIMVLLGSIDDLEFVAVEGPTVTDVLGTHIDGRLLPAPLLDQLIAERSVLLDQETCQMLRNLYGAADVDDTFFVAGLKRGSEVRGAILVAGPTPVLAELRSLVEALGDMVSLSLERIDRGEERFRALIQHSVDVFTVVGVDGRLKYASPSLERSTGWTETDLRAGSLLDWVHPNDLAAVLETVGSIMGEPGRTVSFEGRMRHKAGGYRHAQVTVTNLVDDPAIGGIMMTSRDITDRKALEEALSHKAFHDTLTGLANRTLFSDRVSQAIARGARSDAMVGVLFCDLDDFKVVNDTLGHFAGDLLLQEVAVRLTASLRPGDTAARLGGDEFAVLLDELSGPDDAVAVAERFLAALEAPIDLGQATFTVGASIGVAVAQAHEAVADDLVRDADLAMYRTKDRGKGGVAVFGAEATMAHLASR